MADTEAALEHIIAVLDEDRAAVAQLRVKWPQLILALDEARTTLAHNNVRIQLSAETETPEQEQEMAKTTETPDADEWKSWSTVVLTQRGNKTHVKIYGPTSSKKVADAAVLAYGNGHDSAMVVQNERMPKLNELRRISDAAAKKQERAKKS